MNAIKTQLARARELGEKGARALDWTPYRPQVLSALYTLNSLCQAAGQGYEFAIAEIEELADVVKMCESYRDMQTIAYAHNLDRIEAFIDRAEIRQGADQ